MSIEVVQQELARLTNEAKGNLDAVREEVTSLKREHADLVQKSDTLQAHFREFEQNSLTGMSGRSHSAPKSIASEIAKSESFAAFSNGDTRSFRIRLERSIHEAKALTSEQGSPNSPADGYNVQPTRLDGIYNYPIRPLSIVDVMSRLQVSTNQFEHHRINSDYTDAAAVQATEGSSKAEQAIDPTLVVSNISTVAVTLPVSRQVLADVPALNASLAQILGHGVMKRLESELIAGAGGQGEILGLQSIANAAVADSPAGDLPDLINDNLADLQAEGWMPNAILMHPRTWATIRAERDNDQYLLGPPGSSVGNTLWNTPVVVSPVVQEGRFFVGDFRQSFLLDRQSLTIEAFEQHSDFARKNLVLMRAEVRAGLAVPAPSAFRYFDAS